jgi:hypothetical protein
VAREGFTQSVNQWHSKKFLEAEGTADVYRSNLNTYWQRSLKAQGLPTIDDWIATVRKEQESTDVSLRRKWGSELESLVNSYVSPTTGRLLGKSAKNVLVASVTSYLKRCLGDRLESYDFTLGTKAEQIAEISREGKRRSRLNRRNQGAVQGSQEQTRQSILSTLLSGGCGVAEWIQFANEWFRYVDDKRQAKRPFESTSPGPR